jgi:hypothetical protein
MPQWINSEDDEPLVRRQQDFRAGVDEFTDASTIGDMQLQRLENMVIEDNGRARLRPGADALGGSALVAARIDVLTYFDTPSFEYIYAAVSASLRQWDGASWSNVAGYPFGGNSIVDMVEGTNLLYCTAGTGQWYSYTGAAWSAALGNTAADPPNGASIICWHTQRMFATGSIGGVNDQIYVSNLLSATTGAWDHATKAFRVGNGDGQAITAMCSAKGYWLAVGKEGSIYMVGADPTQLTLTNWAVRRLTDAVGVVGKRAMVSFGDFLVVFSRDGLRKISSVPSEEGSTPWEITTPFSEPVQPYINRVNWAVANKIVLHKYRHYLFCAIPLDSATEPNYVLVWNSRLGSWNGVWLGMTPTAMCTSRFGSQGERFIIGDSTGKVNAWKDYASTSLASTYQENSSELPSELRGKAWNFDAPINWKDGSFAEVIFLNSSGNVDIVAYLDGVEQRRRTSSLLRITNQLPVSLPFDLATANPDPVTMPLDEMPEFREAFIAVETTSGYVEIKSVSVAAFMNTMKNE